MSHRTWNLGDDLPPDERTQSRNWVLGKRDDGRDCRFTKTPDVFNLILPLDLAYFLGVLVDWERRKSAPSNKGWFYFSIRSIKKRFPFISDKVHRRLFALLRERGYIKTRMVSDERGAHRWIWIDYPAIHRGVLAALQEQAVDLDEED